MALAIGSKLEGRYQLRREIARGQRSVVYQAQHQFTLRSVALKVLYGPAARDETQRDVLLAEARLITELRHPCVVTMIDAGQVSDPSVPGPARPYLVMEMLEGRSLAGVLAARRQLEVEDGLTIALGLCSALACAHESGVVHQAISPQNLFLPPAGPGLTVTFPGVYEPPVKLIDFSSAARAIVAGVDERPGRTSDGAAAAYLAPEQHNRQPTDERCDIFSLGVVFYECLTGQLPFEGSAVKLTSAQQIAPPIELRAEVPGALSDAVLRALAPNPADRYPDARAFAHALRTANDQAPPSKSTIPPVMRRAAPRASYLTPVRVHRAGGVAAVDGSTEDISEGGMLLLGPCALEDEEQVQVRFALPISGQVITVNAVARWRRE
ncbi:MAG: hypothetical protein DRI90_21560, partial [Deltaproteobacteria bacterium]